MMTQYSKPALTVDQQIDLLIHRGMQIPDRNQAHSRLTHISYYRLRAYWLPFEEPASNGEEHAFKRNTNFATVLSIYDFDRELRLLLIDAVERVEISLRTRLANELTLLYGPFAHEDSTNFANEAVWQKSRDDLSKEFKRSRETFARHYRNQYPLLASPPLWVACELMSLGQLSHWLQNTRLAKDRQAIAQAYGLDEKVFVSFVHHLSIVRNHCAHHGRMWNRKLSLEMKIPNKKPANLAAQFNLSEDRRLYNTLTMLAYLMSVVSPLSSWRERLKNLVQTTPQIDPADMGFPLNWERFAIWQDVPVSSFSAPK
jgi:abortive infection bacteriophage resistance protein